MLTLVYKQNSLSKRIVSTDVPGKIGGWRPRRSSIDSVKSDLEVRVLNLCNHNISIAQDTSPWWSAVHQ